jgi:hypothetical protein
MEVPKIGNIQTLTSALTPKTLPKPTNQKLQLAMDSKTLTELSHELNKVMNVRDIQMDAVKAAGLVPAKQRAIRNSDSMQNGNHTNNNNNANKKPRTKPILTIPTMSNPKGEANNTNTAIKEPVAFDEPEPDSPKRKILNTEKPTPAAAPAKPKPNVIKKKPNTEAKVLTDQVPVKEKKVYPLKDRYKKYVQGVLMNRIDPKWKEYRDTTLADTTNNNGALKEVIKRENEMMDSIKSQRSEIASTIAKYIQKKIDNSTQAVVKSYNKIQELLYVTINATGVKGCNVTHLLEQQQPCYITGKKIPKNKSYFVEMELVDASKVRDYVDANDDRYKVIVAEEWATFIRNWVLLCNIDTLAIGEYEDWVGERFKNNRDKNQHPEQLVAAFLSENKGEHLEELFQLSKSTVAYFKEWIQSEQDILEAFESRIEPEWTQ